DCLGPFIAALSALGSGSAAAHGSIRIEPENFRELKKPLRFRFDEVRQRFRLTPTEKRVAAFVVAAFALGLSTKCYRDAHQSPSLPQPNNTRTKFASPAPASTPARKRTGKAR